MVQLKTKDKIEIFRFKDQIDKIKSGKIELPSKTELFFDGSLFSVFEGNPKIDIILRFEFDSGFLYDIFNKTLYYRGKKNLFCNNGIFEPKKWKWI